MRSLTPPEHDLLREIVHGSCDGGCAAEASVDPAGGDATARSLVALYRRGLIVDGPLCPRKGEIHPVATPSGRLALRCVEALTTTVVVGS